jgi:hypothetical protein
MAERRYLVDRDFNSFRSSAPQVVRRAMELSLLTEQGLGALLAFRWRDVQAIGVPRDRWKIVLGRVQSRVPKKLFIGHELEGVLKACRLAEPSLPREFVLRLEDGLPLALRDFNQLWDLYMRRWVARGELRVKFSFADIRKKALADKKRRTLALPVRRGH